MRIRLHKSDDGRTTGYTMWLSARDTYAWAHRINALWPCSHLSGKRAMIVVDSNGLCDLAINGRDPAEFDLSGDELDAIVSDYVPAAARHLWPCWGK